MVAEVEAEQSLGVSAKSILWKIITNTDILRKTQT